MTFSRLYSIAAKPIRTSLRDSIGKMDISRLIPKANANTKPTLQQSQGLKQGKPKQNSNVVDKIGHRSNSSASSPNNNAVHKSRKQVHELKPAETESTFKIDEIEQDHNPGIGTKFLKSSSKKGGDRDKLKRQLKQEKKELFAKNALKNPKMNEKSKVKNIYLHEGITVANLCSLIGVPLKTMLMRMKHAGLEEYAPDHVLNSEWASMIVLEFNMNPIVTKEDLTDVTARPEPEDWSIYPQRPPVITIMGHVDHGKTTLLDSLRKTSVAANEAGGITQHIGAFSVLLPSGKRITFLDTPGHAAFSQMRERGAQCTDIVVLVVAADDGVMPQTIEAIKHSQNAGVPIIVALNKCDKPGVTPKKVLEELMRHNVIVEEYGGDIPCVKISGKTGLGLQELEETILAIAEVSDFRGDPTGMVEGVVIESKMSKEFGNVATMIVKRGTLMNGNIIVAGNSWCKVRRMINENGEIVEKATPSHPVEVLGWKELPEAGDEVIQADSESTAKKVSKNRLRKLSMKQTLIDIDVMNEKRAISNDDEEVIEKVKLKEYRVLVKADVHGSLEAIETVLGGLPNHEVVCKIVGSGVGNLTESDIEFANATKASIIAFNTPIQSKIQGIALQNQISLHPHSVIYTLVDQIKESMSALLEPEVISTVEGEANVLQLFNITIKKKVETIAGCRILSGKVMRSNAIRVVRNGEMIYEGKIKTFKHHKKDIMEASKGLECGISIENFDDIKEGDVIQSILIVTKNRKIE